ncbi:AMP-binding domain-containing protein [Penicillium ucsense]|uniref:AMP-binding domain-containing protein n=1 Tax=Penicillium ucsense TaxID=2839758 RepID=A0A8J8WA48_9EURO|nr:AMP-binding domain-containing protein [Penicillium ucsense]KAF7739325.1 AMP-binding domain-containing protein [Penicillium ucsense]
MAPFIRKLPNEPLFRHLLNALRNTPSNVLLRDYTTGLTATCSQFLMDMLHMREQIIKQLPPSMLDSEGRIASTRPYIRILAPRHYDFLVAAFAILSCGGAWASLATTLSKDEASYIVGLSNAACLLFSPESHLQALKIQQHHAKKKTDHELESIIPITRHGIKACLVPEIQIEPSMSMDPRGPGALLFSSGSTGSPKGIVRPRSMFYANPDISQIGQVMLALGPPISEVIEDSAHSIWERLLGKDVNHFTSHPHRYAELMMYFKEHIKPLPSEQRERYIKGAQRVQSMNFTGDFTWPTVMIFWREMLGRPLVNEYGSSEMGSIMTTTDESDPSAERCIGKPWSGVHIKLSEGDHGDILVKSPMMFTHYLGNEAATLAAFDEDGFFRTGDVGYRVGDQYVLEGRASTDVFRHESYWVDLKEIEARVNALPYISEAYVVAADFSCLRQIAVLARLTIPNPAVDLSRLRVDLQGKLHEHNLPTLLRIFQDHEKVPELANGKLNRKSIAQRFFPLSVDGPLPSNIEFWDEKVPNVNGQSRTWSTNDTE